MSRRVVVLLLIIVTALLFSAPDSEGVQKGSMQLSQGPRSAPRFKPGFNLFTPQQDVEIGRQSAEKIMMETPMMDDPQIVGYIRNLGAKLVARAPGDRFPYQFQVVATREINAFALPGGYLFVNAGAITAAHNEGELAGVMAHEISHVVLRHGTNQASKAQIAQLGLNILGQVRPDSNLFRTINMIGGFGANMLFLKFGRGAEKQADLEGARILAEAGYDPRDMANFFNTLGAENRNRPPEFLSDHPDDGNRNRYILEAIPALPVAARPIHNSYEFEQVRARLLRSESSISPESQLRRIGAENLTSGGRRGRPESPAAAFKLYREKKGAFEVQAPSNWDGMILDDSDANSAYIFAPKGGYGKLNNSMMVTHGFFVGAIKVSERDLRSATDAFIRRHLEANPDFQVARETIQTPFSGQQGFVSVVSGPSSIGAVTEINIIYTAVTDDGRLFYLITVVPEDEADAYYPSFKQIQQSVKLSK